MNIDTFIFKLTILLTPGFLTLHVIKTYSDVPFEERRILSAYDFVLILVFSLVNASIFDLGNSIRIGYLDSLIFNWISQFDGNFDVSFSFLKFLFLCSIGLLLGMVIVKLNSDSIPFKIMRFFGISDIYGRDDVWNRFLSGQTPNQWVTIRDFSNELIYTGLTALFSESTMKRELVLTDVEVFKLKDTSEPMYATDWIYLELRQEYFTIEIQNYVKKEKQDGKKSKSRKSRSGYCE